MNGKQIILDANASQSRPLNILTFPTHERYETQLCKTNHNFYACSIDKQKQWNYTYAKMPSNYYLMPKQKILDYVNFDIILAQSRWSQYHSAMKLRSVLNIPVILLDHTTPTIDMMDGEALKEMRSLSGDVNVFISEQSKDAWQCTHNANVITHSIDSELFSDHGIDRLNKVLSVANDYINRDYCLNFSGWQRITSHFDYSLVGDTPGLSVAAADTDELVRIYNSHSVFLNTSIDSPLPMSLLEAMSCGCAVVSTATQMIPSVIKNDFNGFISNDENEIIDKIQYLLDTPSEARRIGSNARQTILDNFGEESFIHKWNTVFDLTRRMK